MMKDQDYRLKKLEEESKDNSVFGAIGASKPKITHI